MQLVPHDPAEMFPAYPGCVHAMEVAGGTRLLFIIGLNGFHEDGTSMPESFEAQAELIWRHIGTLLKAARRVTRS